MGADILRFKDPATARAYIRNLAIQFGDPEDMFAFLKACDIAQAALAYWLFEAHKSPHISEVSTEGKCSVELEATCDEYCHASEEFQQAKKNLKKIISKLDEHNPSECVPDKLGLGDSEN